MNHLARVGHVFKIKLGLDGFIAQSGSCKNITQINGVGKSTKPSQGAH